MWEKLEAIMSHLGNEWYYDADHQVFDKNRFLIGKLIEEPHSAIIDTINGTVLSVTFFKNCGIVVSRETGDPVCLIYPSPLD